MKSEERCELCGRESKIVLDEHALCHTCHVMVREIQREQHGEPVEVIILRVQAKARGRSIEGMLVERVERA